MTHALKFSTAVTIAVSLSGCGGSASETPFPQQPPPPELEVRPAEPTPATSQKGQRTKPTTTSRRVGDAGTAPAPQF